MDVGREEGRKEDERKKGRRNNEPQKEGNDVFGYFSKTWYKSPQTPVR